MAGSTERELIEAAQTGDPGAFGALIRQNQKRLFRSVYGLVNDFDAAEDIVQEAFVRAWKGMDSFRPDKAFYPWLATIARNLALNMLKRERKKESLDELEIRGFDPQSVDLGPLEKLLDEEGQKRLYKAVIALPVNFREVFVLKHFEEMTYDQIARRLDIPPGTVDSRLYRARQALIKDLEDLL